LADEYFAPTQPIHLKLLAHYSQTALITLPDFFFQSLMKPEKLSVASTFFYLLFKSLLGLSPFLLAKVEVSSNALKTTLTLPCLPQPIFF